jgi:hypothetical protein
VPASAGFGWLRRSAACSLPAPFCTSSRRRHALPPLRARARCQLCAGCPSLFSARVLVPDRGAVRFFHRLVHQGVTFLFYDHVKIGTCQDCQGQPSDPPQGSLVITSWTVVVPASSPTLGHVPHSRKPVKPQRQDWRLHDQSISGPAANSALPSAPRTPNTTRPPAPPRPIRPRIKSKRSGRIGVSMTKPPVALPQTPRCQAPLARPTPLSGTPIKSDSVVLAGSRPPRPRPSPCPAHTHATTRSATTHAYRSH